MEDPRKDIVHVVKGLVYRPTLKQQAEVLRRYFAPDVVFYHFHVNIGSGVDDLIAIYQMAELLFNYQAVQFEKIIYDESVNALALQLIVYVRPWISLGREVALDIFVLVELEDWPQPDGRVLKRIKVQRDYFERDPILQMVPIIGEIYGSHKLRFIIGKMQAMLFESVRFLFTFFPEEIKHGIFGLWVHSKAKQYVE